MSVGINPTIRYAAAAFAVVAVMLSGCDRVSERAHAEAPQVGETAEPAGPSAGEKGADCSVDADCNSYFRCIESQCGAPPAVTGEHDQNTPTVRFIDKNGGEVGEFYVELARSDAEQQRGLMFRREMQPDWGMLFVYDDEAQRSFWMENTFISLDLIFIDADGEVDSMVESAEPLTRVKRRSRGPAKYVLELNAGTAETLGIEPGMQVQISGVDADADIAPPEVSDPNK